MTIRKSTKEDLQTILQLIDEGRKKMVAEGNTSQWQKGHPSPQVIMSDIKNGNSYLILQEDQAIATFALIKGPDPTYAVIYEGEWLNDNSYYDIHRVASMPNVHGVMRMIMEHAFSISNTIRIDTHRNNLSMQNLLRKYGFTYCGIIHLVNGDPRLAFQKTV